MKKFRLAVLISHPIQYYVPFYRRLEASNQIDLTVFFAGRWGTDGAYLDPGFGQRLKWDVPLLEGYPHHFLPNWASKAKHPGFFNEINPSIIAKLRQGNFDAVLLNSHNSVTNLLALAVAKLSGIAVFMRCDTHLGQQRSMFKKRVRRFVMSRFYRLFDRCLPIGTCNADYYRAYGVSAEKLFLTPFSVDNDFFISRAEQVDVAQTKSELGLPDDKPVILFVSKLSGGKRPIDLLRAFHQLQQRGHDASLVYVGSGVLEAELRTYVAQHQMQDVTFCGFQNQTQLPKFYASADLFVFPVQNEAWGLVVNEAMCAGLPIIATYEIGAAPDLVKPGENGFLFETGDVSALSTHLETLVTQPELRARMGAESLKLIKRWSYEQCVDGIVAALESMVVSEPPRLGAPWRSNAGA